MERIKAKERMRAFRANQSVTERELEKEEGRERKVKNRSEKTMKRY